MKIAVLFDHFGPYHLARLQAAARDNEVLGVEFRGRSQDYAWEVGERPDMPLATLDAGDGADVGDRLNEVLARFDPDVIAVPGWASPEALRSLQWCLLHRVPAVLMTESTAHDEVRVAWKESVKRRVVKLFPAAFAGGTAHAAYLRDLGIPAENIFMGYDAVDNTHFFAGTSATDLQRRGFLASARFIDKKNLPNLLRAYAAYRQAAGADAWSLTLLGDGPLRPQLETLVAELDLQSSVTMPGFKQYPELPHHYAAAAAFIHASTTEQWGLVVNEAMASGLPVLVSNRCGCAPDLVREGVNGFVFDPFDVGAMTQALTRLATLPQDRLNDMGSESRRIIAEWGPERFASGLNAAATCALAAGPARAGLAVNLLLRLLISR